jgi:pimeloyl-ACP methyl ester carboxylesterase
MMREMLLALVAILPTIVGIAHANEPILLSGSSTETDADRALVLVHGLLGSPTSSFGNLPQIIAADDTQLPGHGKMSDFAVYAVDYEAAFTSRGSLEDIANGVAAEIAESQLFRRHRHFWFVAHSMGGLVLKRTLALWKLQGKNVLLDRITGVGLLGVPSAGAPLADFASAAGAGQLATFFGWNGGLVTDLTTEAGQRYLDSLENDWIAVKGIRDSGAVRRFTPIIYCGYETKPESRALELLFGAQYGIIVPKLFATSACDDKRGFPVTHTELIKPPDARSQVYGWLRDLINRSAASGLQEQRDSMSTAPDVPSYLSNRVDFQNQDLDPVNLDRATALPREPERVEFADERSSQLARQFVLRGGPFYGSTKSNLYEAVAKKNTCLDVKFTPNRLVIVIGFRTEPVQCQGGATLVCPGQPCD